MEPNIRFSAVEWKRMKDGWAKVEYSRELIKADEFTKWKHIRTFPRRLTDKEYFVKRLNGTL